MKKLTLKILVLIILLILSANILGSTNTIKDVLEGKDGQVFEVSGTVIAPKDLLGKGTFYIQDESLGLMIYAPNFKNKLNIGDYVTITGKRKTYYGIVEIVANKIEVTGTSTPSVLELKEVSKTYLSNLVYVEGKVKKKNKYDFLVETDNFTIKVYIKKGTKIDISKIKTNTYVKIIGILSLFKNEYEILPRTQDDIIIK